MAIRKDANTLTAAERAEFVAAILAVKAEGIYDQFVLRHANAIMSAIHRCPAFLPWHRRFILDLEREQCRAQRLAVRVVPRWSMDDHQRQRPSRGAADARIRAERIFKPSHSGGN